MKLFLALLIACASIVNARQTSERVVLSPEHPKVGERVSVLYHTDRGPSFIRNASALSLDLLLVYRDHTPAQEFRQVPMTKRGEEWVAAFTVENPKTRLLLVRFVAGDSVDDDEDNVWAAMIHDEKGRPVLGAHLAMASLYQYGIASFKRQRNDDLRQKELREELASYPDSWDAATSLWTAMPWKEKRDSLAKIVRPTLEKWCDRDARNDALLARYPAWFELIGDSAKAREIRAAGTAAAPGGKVALESRMTELRGVDDPAKAVAVLQRVLTDFPHLEPEDYQNKLSILLRNAVKAKNLDVASDVLARMPKPASFNFTQVAGKLLASGVRDDRAEAFAKKAVEMTAVPDPNERMYFKTETERKESWAYGRSSALQTYALVLSAYGNPAQAVTLLAEAHALTKGEDADIDQQYVRALIGSRSFGKAVEVGLATIAQGKGTDSLVTDLRQAYAGREGATAYASLDAGRQKGFDLLLARAREEMVTAVRKKVVASRISQPSVDFTLNDLHGVPVHLAALKGNVVILDFWATWCNPCKISFPFLKKVYDRYKTNPRVTFLAIDTWERLKDYAATVENAKKFQAENHYEWTVLVDGENEVVGKYNVDGIPTKFILGGDGTIAFKGVGFNGPDMEEELTQQIELLLSEMGGGSR